MTPQQEYRRLNKLIWLGRLPSATIILVENETMPACHGVTWHDGTMFVKPIIVLNKSSRGWRQTLIHEMIHVAEPGLAHGDLFESLVRRYVRVANKHRKIKAPIPAPPSEEKNVG